MKLSFAIATTALLLLVAQPAPAGPKPDKPETFATRAGAIRGYDPVAYFTDKAPVKGNKSLRYNFKGADWVFASEENRQLFIDDPEKYAPQYGGWCAYAMGRGYFAKTDPDAWTIEDGKLYLNYSLSIREKWLKDVPGYIAKGDANWAGFYGADEKPDAM